MGGAARLVGLLLALAALCKGWSGLEPLSARALVLYPWLVLVGLPRRASTEPALGALARDLGWLLPLLAWAWRIDRATAPELGLAGDLVGLALFAGLGLAAGLARGDSRARALHAWAWWVLVVLLPLGGAVASWGLATPHAGAAQLVRASPLGWNHIRCGPGALETPDPYLALAMVALLLLLGSLARGRRGMGEART